MKKNESSITSLISAFGRAYHCQYDAPLIFDDFIAKALITPQEFTDIRENMIRGIQFFDPHMADQFSGDPDNILRWITQVQLSPITLARSAYCEQVLLHEVTLGLRQVIILGAGMDTFALRHPELETTLDVFEVDFPSTQQLKKERLHQAELVIPGNLHFVPLDFTEEIRKEEWAEAGVASVKTVVTLLGVSYYLSREDLLHLLRGVFLNLPPGSSIIMDYADEFLFEHKGRSNRVENMVKMAAMGGEPMQSCFTSEDMGKLMEDAGLLIYEHLTPEDIQDRYFSNRTDDLSAFETNHFIHAFKK